MIEKMKKVSLVLLSKDRESALGHLANAQVFHSSAPEGSSEKLSELQAQRAHVSFALEALPKVKKFSSEQIDILSVVENIHTCRTQLSENEEIILSTTRELQRTEMWGDFDREDYETLIQAGLFVGLYQVPKKEYSQWQQTATAAIINMGSYKDKILVLAVAFKENELPAGHEFEMPQSSFRKMRENLALAKTNADKAAAELKRLAVHAQSIKQFLAVLDERIEFETFSCSMQHDDELSYIQGYIPEGNLKKFKDLCAKHAWAALYEDVPEDDEAVPTKLKHYGVGALVKPLLGALDLLPGYREFDITFVMFFFFTLFFAMIIGDAGYGSLFTVAGVAMMLNNLIKGKPFNLGLFYFTFLSAMTVVWGALTGVWFGYPRFNSIPVLSQWINPWLVDPNNIMTLCFWIGTTHLLIAHTWAFLRALRTNFFYAFSQVGHFMMIFALQYVVYLLLLNKPLPGDWVLSTTLIGFTLVVFFNQQIPGGNPIKQAFVGLANIFPTTLGCVSNFSDIISYIRLYAVSLAGFSIANAFNGMAESIPAPMIYFAAPILLLLAHTVNMMLCLLSVIVHGLRLNSLEFSSHLGLEWKGIPYKPFGGKK